jgi:hypothetical protein
VGHIVRRKIAAALPIAHGFAWDIIAAARYPELAVVDHPGGVGRLKVNTSENPQVVWLDKLHFNDARLFEEPRITKIVEP